MCVPWGHHVNTVLLFGPDWPSGGRWGGPVVVVVVVVVGGRAGWAGFGLSWVGGGRRPRCVSFVFRCCLVLVGRVLSWLRLGWVCLAYWYLRVRYLSAVVPAAVLSFVLPATPAIVMVSGRLGFCCRLV